MNYPNRTTHWYSLAFVVLAADQAAKSYIAMTTPLGWSHEVTPFFNLVHALNPGAAFSFLAIALAASIWLAWMLSKPVKRLEALAYSLILGGALGNAFDRALRGQVVDYLDFHLAGKHWPAFNVADMAITAGAVGMIAASLFGQGSAKPSSPEGA